MRWTARLVLTALLLSGCSGEDAGRSPADEDAIESTTTQAVAEPTDQAIRSVDFLNATMPSNTCAGWPHAPIKLTDGEGESRLPDGSFGGATIGEARVLGYADFNHDDSLDALLWVTCFGSPHDMCCAGRGAIRNYGVAFSRKPSGDLIILGPPIDGGPERKIWAMELDGEKVITEECVLYPEAMTEAELGYPPESEVASTYEWNSSRWDRSDDVRGTCS